MCVLPLASLHYVWPWSSVVCSHWNSAPQMACFTSHNGDRSSHFLLQAPLSIKLWENSISYLNSDWWRVDLGAALWPPWLNQDIAGHFSSHFCALVQVMRKNGFRDSHCGISIEEQLGIFLYTCVTDLSTYNVVERFQHSPTMISIYVRLFLSSHQIMIIKNDPQIPQGSAWFFLIQALLYIEHQATDRKYPVLIKITSDPHFCYFSDCVSAVEGTHIQASVLVKEHPNMQNRKGFLSQNCLFICDFDLIFTYAVTGLDGSIADATMWYDAHTDDLAISEGKYLLADAKFSLSDTLLVLYRGVQYHLKEWRQADLQ